MASGRGHATAVVAVVSMIWYTVSISQYSYQKVLAWSYYPPLIGVVICRLLFPACTSPRTLSKPLPRPVATLRHRCELFLPSECRVLERSYRTIRSLLDRDGHGNVIGPTILVAILPCSAYLLHRVITCEKINPKSFANHVGIMGVIASSSLLYPVTRFSVLMRALNLSEINAIKIHIYAGILAMFGGAVHGLYYCVTWILNRKTVHDLFPVTGECWPMLFEDMNMEGDSTTSHCCCRFVNLTGVVAGIAFIILGLASLWKIRRKYYRPFYYIHVSMSIVALFSMVMHWRGTIIFIAPGFLFYTANNVPVYVEGLYKSMWLKGVHITNIVCIPDSRGCIEISMKQLIDSDRATPLSLRDSAIATIGKYTRLFVPDVSAKSHPFTIFTAPYRPKDEITILFRPIGPFTEYVSRRFREFTVSTEPDPSESGHFPQKAQMKPDQNVPKILVNGIGYGTSNQLKDASKHENIIIIAGGVGIVAFISLIIALQSRGVDESNDQGRLNPTRPRNIQVRWICRDKGLIDHVVQNYFAPLFENTSYNTSSIIITVHHTEVQMMEGSKPPVYPAGQVWARKSPSVSALPNSLYDNSSPTILKSNIISTAAMSSIILGGILVFHRNYPKTYLASKPIALFQLFGWALLLSALCIGIVNLGETVAAKLKSYTKLIDSEAVNELEFAEVHTSQEQSSKSNVADENVDNYDAAPDDAKDPLDGTLHSIITHMNGRPNMRTIFTDAMGADAEEDECSNDFGIFVCGPTVMTDAVWGAISEVKEEEERGQSFQATVYPEIFEM